MPSQRPLIRTLFNTFLFHPGLGGGGGGSSQWILYTGLWNDGGLWDDTETWNDG